MECQENYIPFECHSAYYDSILEVYTYEILFTQRISFNKNFDDPSLIWNVYSDPENNLKKEVENFGLTSVISEYFNRPSYSSKSSYYIEVFRKRIEYKKMFKYNA
jgi:hypothetical protein